MCQRIFRIFSSIGLSIFVLFMFASTSAPTFAHGASNKLHYYNAIPHAVDTSVICSPNGDYGQSFNYTGNGPASFGCGGAAWEATTTGNDVWADYDFGYIDKPGRYQLNAFITNHANAPMNYDINAYDQSGNGHMIVSCFYNQALGIAFKNICTFNVTNADVNRDLSIYEWSGAVHSFIISASAVQLIPR